MAHVQPEQVDSILALLVQAPQQSANIPRQPFACFNVLFQERIVPLHQRLKGVFRQRGFHVPHRGVDGIHLGIHAIEHGLDAPRVFFEAQQQQLHVAQIGRSAGNQAAAVGARLGRLPKDQRNGRNDADDLPGRGLPQRAWRCAQPAQQSHIPGTARHARALGAHFQHHGQQHHGCKNITEPSEIGRLRRQEVQHRSHGDGHGDHRVEGNDVLANEIVDTHMGAREKEQRKRRAGGNDRRDVGSV